MGGNRLAILTNQLLVNHEGVTGLVGRENLVRLQGELHLIVGPGELTLFNRDGHVITGRNRGLGDELAILDLHQLTLEGVGARSGHLPVNGIGDGDIALLLCVRVDLNHLGTIRSLRDCGDGRRVDNLVVIVDIGVGCQRGLALLQVLKDHNRSGSQTGALYRELHDGLERVRIGAVGLISLEGYGLGRDVLGVNRIPGLDLGAVSQSGVSLVVQSTGNRVFLADFQTLVVHQVVNRHAAILGGFQVLILRILGSAVISGRVDFNRVDRDGLSRIVRIFVRNHRSTGRILAVEQLLDNHHGLSSLDGRGRNLEFHLLVSDSTVSTSSYGLRSHSDTGHLFTQCLGTIVNGNVVQLTNQGVVVLRLELAGERHRIDDGRVLLTRSHSLVLIRLIDCAGTHGTVVDRLVAIVDVMVYRDGLALVLEVLEGHNRFTNQTQVNGLLCGNRKGQDGFTVALGIGGDSAGLGNTRGLTFSGAILDLQFAGHLIGLARNQARGRYLIVDGEVLGDIHVLVAGFTSAVVCVSSDTGDVNGLSFILRIGVFSNRGSSALRLSGRLVEVVRLVEFLEHYVLLTAHDLHTWEGEFHLAAGSALGDSQRLVRGLNRSRALVVNLRELAVHDVVARSDGVVGDLIGHNHIGEFLGLGILNRLGVTHVNGCVARGILTVNVLGARSTILHTRGRAD